MPIITGTNKYIEVHLFNELKYLLCATKVWKLIEDKKIKDNIHMQVYAMTSVFVHSRNLYLFFTEQAKQKSPHISDAYNILPKLPVSQLFKKYKRTIEAKVLHLNPLNQRESNISINKLMIDITNDVLDIIAQNIVNLEITNPAVAEYLKKMRSEAINSANQILPAYPLSGIVELN
ncbi:MAG: hypothetical protein QY314_01020 [Candidatus Dojkabacteria bacterium]|nr:MAG: hypothetical protein QY314_01020 [Candidatus Dojkabacteria bacterium]